MAIVGMAGLCHQRDGCAAEDGGGADLCTALRTLHPGGIAGEDDLDAPDLNPKFEDAPKIDLAPNIAAPMRPESASTPASKIRFTNSASGPRDKSLRPARATLDPEQSAKLRERLLATVAQLQSEEEAADWAHKNMPAKNTLIAAESDLVESAFKDKLEWDPVDASSD
jgi:hypothetical protein